MKRFLCVLMVLAMLPIFAQASGVDEFNVFASVLGASELDPAKAKSKDPYTQYEQDGCAVGFEEKDGKIVSVFIDGDGMSFLAYCCAAIRCFDPEGNTTTNHGQLLTAYLLAKNADEYSVGQTTNGKYFFFTYEDGKYTFMVME